MQEVSRSCKQRAETTFLLHNPQSRQFHTYCSALVYTGKLTLHLVVDDTYLTTMETSRTIARKARPMGTLDSFLGTSPAPKVTKTRARLPAKYSEEEIQAFMSGYTGSQQSTAAGVRGMSLRTFLCDVLSVSGVTLRKLWDMSSALKITKQPMFEVFWLAKNPFLLAKESPPVVSFDTCINLQKHYKIDVKPADIAGALVVDRLHSLVSGGNPFVVASKMETALQECEQHYQPAMKAAVRAEIVTLGIGGKKLCTTRSLYKRMLYIERTLSELGEECEDDEEDEVWSERFAGSCGELQFNVQQQGAMLAIYNKPGVVITGGPGTGKTTVIAAANKLLWAQGTTVFNVAFSGKAVKVLRDKLRPGAHCYTMHRFLRVIIHEETALDFQGSVIICDEASMVDIVLFDELLRHVDATQSRLVLVGDPDQLPPVGLGTPFNDLVSGINAGHIVFPRWKLTETNRYAADMAAFVDGIQRGVWKPPATVSCIEMPSLPGHRVRGDYHNGSTASRSCWDVALQDIMDIIEELFEEHPELRDISKTMFLAPQHEYVCGTQSLSAALQKVLNPEGTIMAACSANYGRKKGSLMKEDDSVVRTVNSYGTTEEDDDHYNGDDAIVKRSTRANKYVVSYNDGTTEELGAHQLRDDFELGYIRTIHKSQGGETDNVVLVGPVSCHAMWRMPGARKLLTVALSRAKKSVYVLGHSAAIAECLKSRDEIRIGRMFHRELAKDARTAPRA